MAPSLPKITDLKELDKCRFVYKEELLALRIEAKMSALMLLNLDKYVLKYPRVKRLTNVVDDKSKKLLLLSSSVKTIDDIDEEEKKSFIRQHGLEFEKYDLILDYDYWTAEEIFDAFIPKSMEFSSSFETVGHIIHLNLREELEPYKSIIGQILLDKNSPRIRTVLTKTGNIETKFRTFPMEVIAGEEDFNAEVRENDCLFRFDFSRVYWNSRLHTEHGRIINMCDSGEIIGDVFAGVGPFSIPLARKGCKVYANDLNPDSFKFLNMNVGINKIAQKNIKTSSMDGREFIARMIKEKVDVDHFIMNLPASAIDFLDEFKGYEGNANVHCYLFKRSSEGESEVIAKACDLVGFPIQEYNFHYVRKVAPNKDMYCLSFKLCQSLDKYSRKKQRLA